MTTAAALASLLAATERSVERSKAYHASENLATAYGYYIDEFAWDETADIFSRDGWKELSYVGTYVGRERIRQSLKLRYPNPQVARLPHAPPGRAAGHPRVGGRAQREDSCAAVSDGRSGGRRGLVDLRDLREHVRRRRWHVEVVGHGPGLRLDRAVTRRLGARQDTSRCAGGRDGQGRSRPTVRFAARSQRRSPRCTPFRSITRTRCRATSAAAADSLSERATSATISRSPEEISRADEPGADPGPAR